VSLPHPSTFQCLLETSSHKEGAVGEEQSETQPTSNKSWTSSKEEEDASRPDSNHRRHRHVSLEKKWRYACGLLVTNNHKNMTAERRNSVARQTAVTRKQLGKEVPTAMNTEATIEERLRLHIT
jgi:hypothetical protein